MSSSPPPPNHDPDMDIPSSEMDPEEAPTEPRRKPNVQDAPGTHEQITFQFCRECSNMLYPKEDRMLNKLVYACRTCEFSEDAAAACVYRHDLSNTVGETAGVTQDVAADPTVGHPARLCLLPATLCLLCGQDVHCDICGRGMGGTFQYGDSSDDQDNDFDHDFDDDHDTSGDLETNGDSSLSSVTSGESLVPSVAGSDDRETRA
ncbi:MAG: hypothetical protein M1823_003495 [Watsoniomyces obsoletus]|nr:MAG: hypothetical protein M1823_003495 [Watsoniomyces obsoletus]